MKQLITIIKSLVIMTSSLLALASCTKRQEVNMYKKTVEAMYTTVSITVTSTSEREAESAINEALDRVRELEALLSFWSEESEISLIKKFAGDHAVKVSQPTCDIIRESLFIANATDGAFDPTVGPLMKLWDFKKGIIPEAAAIEDALPLVDYHQITLSEQCEAFLNSPAMSFDTGGIAKGYTADVLVDVLKHRGIRGGLIAVAGDIRAFGSRPDGKPWRVGLKNPRSDDPDAIIASFPLYNESVSTSGDYERFFMHEGRRYSHILNPATGYPASDTISVTVIAPHAVHTDGLATGIFALGPERGMQVINTLGYDGVIITADGRTLITEGLSKRIEWEDTHYRTVNTSGNPSVNTLDSESAALPETIKEKQPGE